ncbi:alpha-glucosidase C-terminal domain-containing protein, partial [Rhizobium sp. TRM95111]|uniref:alpha-glucosidase C-terminal domain-containing protein n=1 Tax=Rhizobium alarense TaxID=2846851 RepID=UPI001F452A15
GRDGCRTPMPWDADAPNAGFSTGKPWLPVPEDHARHAVDRQQKTSGSVLNHYRETLAFRRAHAALVDGDMHFVNSNRDILAFSREKDGEKLLFVFNLTREKVEFVPAKSLKLGEFVAVPGFGAKLEDGTIELDALDMACVRV